MTKIKLHGYLAESLDKSEWGLVVDSADEAIRAINIKTDNKLFNLMLDSSRKNQKYAILIDGEEIMVDGKIKDTEESLEEDFDTFYHSSFFLKKKNIKTIDFIPVVEGAGGDGIFQVLLGAVLVVGSFFTGPLGPAMFAAGVALVASGITAMMMDPPEFSEVKKIEGITAGSYLFNGPVNIVREGAPVPIVYGTVLAGSNVVAVFSDVDQVAATDGQVTA
jgi:predicted phage tail protein